MDILAKKDSQTWRVKSPWGTVTHFCDSGSSPALFLVFWPLLCAPSPMGDPRDLRSQSPQPWLGAGPQKAGPFLRSPQVRKELIQVFPEGEVQRDLQGMLVWLGLCPDLLPGGLGEVAAPPGG